LLSFSDSERPLRIRQNVASRGRSVTPRPPGNRRRQTSPSPNQPKFSSTPATSRRGRQTKRKPTPPTNFLHQKKFKYSTRTRDQSHGSQDAASSIGDVSQAPSQNSRQTFGTFASEGVKVVGGSELDLQEDTESSLYSASQNVPVPQVSSSAPVYGNTAEGMAVAPGYKGATSKEFLHPLRYEIGGKVIQFYVAPPPNADLYLTPFDSTNCENDVPRSGLTHLYYVKDFVLPHPFGDLMEYIGHRLMGHGHAQRVYKNVPAHVVLSKSYVALCKSCFLGNRKCFISATTGSYTSLKQHFEVRYYI
jgi:hypothetical protein